MLGDAITKRSERMHHEGHTHTNTTHPHRCDLASTWAARALITPAAFLRAATHQRRYGDIAAALGVTPEDVNAYLESLTPEEFRIMRRLVGFAVV